MQPYSVLMSVYKKDHPDFLTDAISSMLKQTVLCEQFVLVEDGPLPENLQKVIDGCSRQYPNIFSIIKLSENVGLGRALDKGLDVCRNNLVARMDADDISLPNRCEKLLELFDKNPQLALAGTNIDEFYDNPQNIVSSRKVPCEYENICKFMRRRSPFNHPTVMFKKSEVERCGGYGKMKRKQDFDLFARMLNMGCFALNINESLLFFRSNRDNYKRRRSWEYCKSYLDVAVVNYKRGYCSIFDLAYIFAGQLTLHFAPMWLMKKLSDCLLRKGK